MSNLHPVFERILKPFDYERADQGIEALSRATKGIDWQKYEQVTAAGKQPDETHLEFALRCMSEAQK